MSSTAKTSSKAATAKTSAKAPATPSEDNRVLKKHLVEKVARRVGVRKNEVRPILDAVLLELGAALAEDTQMMLQPLGKVVVKKAKDAGEATVYTCKIRHSGEKS